jgi:hypothetical protein
MAYDVVDEQWHWNLHDVCKITQLPATGHADCEDLGSPKLVSTRLHSRVCYSLCLENSIKRGFWVGNQRDLNWGISSWPVIPTFYPHKVPQVHPRGWQLLPPGGRPLVCYFWDYSGCYIFVMTTTYKNWLGNFLAETPSPIFLPALKTNIPRSIAWIPTLWNPNNSTHYSNDIQLHFREEDHAPFGKGLLVADESTRTIGKRLANINIENVGYKRQALAELLFTAPNVTQHLSGVLLFTPILIFTSLCHSLHLSSPAYKRTYWQNCCHPLWLVLHSLDSESWFFHSLTCSAATNKSTPTLGKM